MVMYPHLRTGINGVCDFQVFTLCGNRDDLREIGHAVV